MQSSTIGPADADARRSADILAAAASAIGAIPGCRLDPTTPSLGPVKPTATIEHLALKVRGRSPSLHDLSMTWHVEIPAGSPTESAITHVLEAISPKLATQRARAASGLALSTAFPLPIPSAPSQLARLDHLHADASALALQLQFLTHDALATTPLHRVRSWLRDIHAGHFDNDGGRTLRSAQIAATEDASGLRSIAFGTDVVTPSDTEQCRIDGQLVPGRRTGATLRGNVLRIPDALLPESATTALPGRPLSALVTLHSQLDVRTIRRVRQGNANATRYVEATLEPLPYPLLALHDRKVGEALTDLHAAITADHAKRHPQV